MALETYKWMLIFKKNQLTLSNQHNCLVHRYVMWSSQLWMDFITEGDHSEAHDQKSMKQVTKIILYEKVGAI